MILWRQFCARKSNFQCAAICFEAVFYNLDLGCTTNLMGLKHKKITERFFFLYVFCTALRLVNSCSVFFGFTISELFRKALGLSLSLFFRQPVIEGLLLITCQPDNKWNWVEDCSGSVCLFLLYQTEKSACESRTAGHWMLLVNVVLFYRPAVVCLRRCFWQTTEKPPWYQTAKE